MTRCDLTKTEKRRFNRNRICPLCNQVIESTDDIMYTIKKVRRCKKYTFYHERCLMYGKEKE